MRVQLILPDGLVARVDELAGSRGRSAFVVRALESALDSKDPSHSRAVPGLEAPGQVAPPTSRSAPSRASGHYPLSSAVAKAGVKPIPKSKLR